MSVNRDEILTAAANGNASALEFLRVFARRAHWVDDVVDELCEPAVGSRTYEAGRIAEMEGEWLLTLSGNPFFLAHRAQLVPAMVLALNAWVGSSEELQVPSDKLQVVRDVVKGQWHEVVWLVAWLTGGWKKMREVSGKYRDYDFEAKKQKTEAMGCLGSDPPDPANYDFEAKKQKTEELSPFSDNWKLCFCVMRKEANGMPGK